MAVVAGNPSPKHTKIIYVDIGTAMVGFREMYCLIGPSDTIKGGRKKTGACKMALDAVVKYTPRAAASLLVAPGNTSWPVSSVSGMPCPQKIIA